jgi:acyl-CoA thioesterase
VNSEHHALLESGGATRKEPGSWHVVVPGSWRSWSGPLGGLLNAIAVGAAADLVPDNTTPQATHTQFVRAFSDAPITIAASVERSGRSAQFVSVRGVQDTETVFTTSVVFGRRTSRLTTQRITAPAVRSPHQCPEIEFPADLVPFARRFEFRQASGAYPMSGAAEAELGAWLRLRDGTPVDTVAAVLMLDAMPPGLYPALTAPAVIASAELAVHLHADLAAHPVDDYVLAVARNVSSHDGWCVDEADLWARDGALLAQSRQLRRVLPLPGSPPR